MSVLSYAQAEIGGAVTLSTTVTAGTTIYQQGSGTVKVDPGDSVILTGYMSGVDVDGSIQTDVYELIDQDMN